MMADKVDYQLNLQGPAGVTTVNLGIGREPMRMGQLATLIHRISDVMITPCIDKEQAEGNELSCRAGCGHCCSQLVPMSGPEAYALADSVLALEPAARQTLFARFEAAKQRIEEGGYLSTLRDLMVHSATADLQVISRSYFALNVSCPFLVEQSCSAYQARPVICRDHNVTSPSEWCQEPELHQIRKVPTPKPFAHPLAAMFAKVTGRPEELIPLPLAFDWVEDNAELGKQQWPGTELFEKFLAELQPA